MLVLSRKKNEAIVVNDDIEITVVEIRSDKVRLGIVAPKKYSVRLKEVWEAIHAAPKTGEKLLPRLQAQREDRQKHGLVWSDPGELKDQLGGFPTDDPERIRLVLHVDPAVSADALARAYGLPILLPGKLQTVVNRPNCPYLVVLPHDVARESGRTDVVVLLRDMLERRQWHAGLLPLEVLLLAIERPELFSACGFTATGVLYTEEIITRLEDGQIDLQRAQAVSVEAYVPSLVRVAENQYRWIIHQGPHDGCRIPLAWHIIPQLVF